MFGQFKPIAFEPYGRRRSRRLVPRWLVLLTLGAAIGAGGVVLVQERYLPPRLSADASAELQTKLRAENLLRRRALADREYPLAAPNPNISNPVGTTSWSVQ